MLKRLAPENLVHLLLNAYQLADPSLILLSDLRADQALYRVDTPTAQYVLRVMAASPRYYAAFVGEPAVFMQLDRHLDAPQWVPPQAPMSTAWQSLKMDLSTFVGGSSVSADKLTAAQAQAMGAYLGQFHALNLAAVHPDTQQPIPTESDEKLLFGAQGIFPLEAFALSLHSEQMTLLRRIVQDMQAAISPSDERMLHGDYLLHNILLEEETVRAIDFEYARRGSRLYDLASWLWQIRPLPDAALLEEHFLQGYEQHELPVHRAQLHVWMAVRQAASILWIIENHRLPTIHAHIERIIAQRFAELEAFQHTGVMKRTALAL